MHAIVRWAVLLLAFSPFVFYTLVLIAAHRFFDGRPTEPPADFTPSVSVLKPVRGLDREPYENFATFCRQNYPDYEILFGVRDENDPVVPVIRRLIRDFPNRQIRLLIGSERVGANDKVNNLIRMAREAKHDILVISDSDIRVDPYYLRSVGRLFRDPAVGAVTCIYRGLADNGSFASELEVMGNSTEFQPGVLVAWMLEGVKFTLGATMAVRRKAIKEAGGFEGLADHYSDDFETGNRIAGCRYKVELCSWPVVTVFPRQTLRECFHHQVRWSLTTRYSRPWGHLGLGLTFGLPWSIAAALVAPSWPVAAAYLGTYCALRVAVAWKVGVRGLDDQVLRRNLWWLPARDAFGLVVWVTSFFVRRIIWRGSAFYVRNQRLVPAGRS